MYVKTYDYTSAGAGRRGWWRNTGPLRRSRAAAEFDALAWMAAQGVPAAEPIVVLETRRYGVLRRAVLVTRAFPGAAADAWLLRLAAGERLPLATAIVSFVQHLHRLGFRDRNLDLRNLLADRSADGTWIVGKIDSPRYRLRRPGRTNDALCRADWARLLPQLATFDIDVSALPLTCPKATADPRS